MNSKQLFLKTIYVYVIPYLVLLMAILGLMYLYPKPELHMLLNSHHSSIQDILQVLHLVGRMALVCAGTASLAVEEDQDYDFLCHV